MKKTNLLPFLSRKCREVFPYPWPVTSRTIVSVQRPGRRLAFLTALVIAVWGGAIGAIAEPLEVRIESDDRMRFDIERFSVKLGQEVKLTLVHTGLRPARQIIDQWVKENCESAGSK